MTFGDGHVPGGEAPQKDWTVPVGSPLSSCGRAGGGWREEETRGALPPGTMLLILGLLVLVPCLALLTSFLLSPGGKSGGNKKNDGVKVSPLLPAPALPCRRWGPRGTVRFEGWLLAQLSPRVPGPAEQRGGFAVQQGKGLELQPAAGEWLQAVASGHAVVATSPPSHCGPAAGGGGAGPGCPPALSCPQVAHGCV